MRKMEMLLSVLKINHQVKCAGAIGKYVFMFLLLSTSVSHAMEPLDNYAAPPGMYFLDYPVYITGDSIKDADGNTAVDDIDLAVSLNIFRFAWYDKTLFNNTSLVTLVMPYGRTELLDNHDTGAGDWELSFWHWLIDDPVNKTYLVVGSYFNIPFGDYDVDNPASMGINVWQARPAIGLAKTIGKFSMELSLKYNFYEKNSETDTKSGNELRVESNVGYFLTERVGAYLHFNAIFGDDKEVGGETVDDSGLTKYQAGPAITIHPSGKVPFMPSIAFQYLADFGVENAAATRTILGRFVWKF